MLRLRSTYRSTGFAVAPAGQTARVSARARSRACESSADSSGSDGEHAATAGMSNRSPKRRETDGFLTEFYGLSIRGYAREWHVGIGQEAHIRGFPAGAQRLHSRPAPVLFRRPGFALRRRIRRAAVRP